MSQSGCVISFRGEWGCGKSTAASYFVERYGAQRMSFAHPLKNSVFDMLAHKDWTEITKFEAQGNDVSSIKAVVVPAGRLDADGKTAFVNAMKSTLGRFLQWHGAREEENLGKMMEAQLRAAIAAGKVVVLDDCRFPGQRDRILQLDAVDIFVKISPETLAQRRAGGNDRRHVDDPTEAMNRLPLDSRIMTNDGPFSSDLGPQLDALAAELGIAPKMLSGTQR